MKRERPKRLSTCWEDMTRPIKKVVKTQGDWRAPGACAATRPCHQNLKGGKTDQKLLNTRKTGTIMGGVEATKEHSDTTLPESGIANLSTNLEGDWMTRTRGRTRPVEEKKSKKGIRMVETLPQLPRSQRQAHTHVRVKLQCQGKSLEVRTLIDTGNTTGSEGPCISLKFVENHSLTYIPVLIRRIGTAAEGSTLEVVGIIKNLTVEMSPELKLTGQTAWVVRHLSNNVNIGAVWLQNNRMTLDFSTGGDGSVIRKDDISVPMISSMGPVATRQDTFQTEAAELEPLIEMRRRGEPAVPRAGSRRTGRPAWVLATELKESGETIMEPARRKWVKAQSFSTLPCKLRRRVRPGDPVYVPQQAIKDNPELILLEGVYPVLANGEIYPVVVNQGDVAELIPGGQYRVVPMTRRLTSYRREAPGGDNNIGIHSVQTPEEESGPELEKLWTRLELGENQMLDKHPKIKKELKEVLHKYRGVFSEAGGPSGTTEFVEAKFVIKEGAEPFRSRIRHLNPTMEGDLRKQVDSWLKEGVIRPSKSPWAAALVPVKKKDGSIRWAVDYRMLNSCLIKDSFPLPNISQLLDRAGGHTIYSTLDATAAYFTIRVAEGSRGVTAFLTPWGLYEFTRMPFGIATAPNIYSRFIAGALQNLGTQGLNHFLDDVLLFHRKMSDHLKRLVEVLEAHRAAGIKIKPEKTKLFRSQVEYLGHLLSEDGLAMIPSYVERILKWESPKTVKQLNTMLGFFQYYRSFIPEFSALTHEMNGMRRKKILEWSEQMEESFQILKLKFQGAPIRAVPDFESSEPFELTTDFSCKAISAILSQRQGGLERFIGVAARKCTPGESNYPSYKGEMCAVMHGVRKYHHILSYKRFILNTDASSLKHIYTFQPQKGIVSRWIEELGMMDFETRHRAGVLNTNADAMSRREDLPEASPAEIAEQGEYVATLKVNQEGTSPRHGVKVIEDDPQGEEVPENLPPAAPDAEIPVGPVAGPRGDMSLSRTGILEAQGEDDILQEVRRWLSTGTVPAREQMRGKERALQDYKRQMGIICIAEDGLLERRLPIPGGERKQILLPTSMQKKAFFWVHEHLTAGHWGRKGTLERYQQYFYFPGLYNDVMSRVKACDQCIMKKMSINQKDTVHSPRLTGFPLEILFIDLIGPFPVSHEMKYVLTAECGFTRYACAYPLRSKESVEVVRVLVENFISRFGCPTEIHSDQGGEFESKVFNGICEALDIKHTTSVAYQPWSNKVERLHGTINQFMRIMLDRNECDWVRYIPAWSLAYNTKVHGATGVTPALAFLGRELRLPLDLMIRLPEERSRDQAQQVRDTMDRITKVFEYLRKQQEVMTRRDASSYSHRANPWRVGNLVWTYCSRKVLGKPSKWTAQWLGPFRVVRICAPSLVVITTHETEGREMTVHITRLRKYHGTGQVRRPIRNQDELEIPMEDEEAEELGNTITIREPVEMGIPVHYVDQPPQGGEMRDLLDELPGVPRALDPMEETFNEHQVEPDHQELEDAIEVDPGVTMETPTEVAEEVMEGDDPEEEPIPSTSAKPTQETKRKRRPRENSPGETTDTSPEEERPARGPPPVRLRRVVRNARNLMDESSDSEREENSETQMNAILEDVEPNEIMKSWSLAFTPGRTPNPGKEMPWETTTNSDQWRIKIMMKSDPP